ncbi:MAG: hypothetical protein WEB06_01045 [Actinomycetota bacterium]
MAAGRRARRAGVCLAAWLASLTACGGNDVPPLPDEFRRLEQREAGCIACHDGRRVAVLDPATIATPSGHPSLGASKILSSLSAEDRARLGL